MVSGQVPDGGSAHAEAAEEDAALIDVVVLLHVVESFEEVDFAGEFAGIAVAAVEVEGYGVAGLELAEVFLAIGDEIELGEILAAAMEPGCRGAIGEAFRGPKLEGMTRP